jgi:hypothetical protein
METVVVIITIMHSLCISVCEECLMGVSCPSVCHLFQLSRRTEEVVVVVNTLLACAVCLFHLPVEQESRRGISAKGTNQLIFGMVTHCVLFVEGTEFSGCHSNIAQCLFC